MSRTRRRLEESRFFLSHLKDSEAKQPDFDYFLNAFATAARSVTWVMRAEYLHVPGWQAWYETQSPAEDESELLRVFTTLRNRSQKEDPLKTNAVVVMNFPPESLTPEFKELLDNGVGKQFQVTFYEVPDDGDLSRLPSNAVLGVLHSAERRLDQLGERDVLDACEKYLAALERLVQRCEAEFAA